MDSWECPHCKAKHEYGHNPDVLDGLSPESKATFTCDCGCEFEMWVDFTVDFIVDRESIRIPKGKAAT